MGGMKEHEPCGMEMWGGRAGLQNAIVLFRYCIGQLIEVYSFHEDIYSMLLHCDSSTVSIRVPYLRAQLEWTALDSIEYVAVLAR